MLAGLMSHIRRNSTPDESTIFLSLYQWTPDPARPKKFVLMPLTLKIGAQDSVLSRVFDRFLACGTKQELDDFLAPAGQVSNQEENTALTLMKQIGEILVISGSHRVYICRQLSITETESPIVRANTMFRIADIWADSGANKMRVQSMAFGENIKSEKVIKTSIPQVLLFLRAAAEETAGRLIAQKAKMKGKQKDLDAGRLRPFGKTIWKVKVKDDLDQTKTVTWKDYHNSHYIAATQSTPLSTNSNDNYFQLILESKVIFEKVVELLQSGLNKAWGIGS